MKLGNIARGIIRSKLLQKPFYVHLYVTRKCNLRCKMCNVWTHGVKEKEMDLNDFNHISKIFKSMGITCVVITGGEPFLRDDLHKIVKLFYKAGFSVRVHTNGSSIVSEDRLKEVIDAGADFINISLDSLDPIKHDYICNSKGLWQHVVKNIERAVRLLPKNRTANVATTISNLNIKELPNIVSFVDNMGAYSLPMPVMLTKSCNANAPYRAFSAELSLEGIDESIVNEVFSELFLLKSRGVKIGMSNKFLQAARDFIISGDMKWDCDAGFLYFAVYPDGSISPCNEIKPIAKIFDKDFIDFLNSNKYKEGVSNMNMNCNGCIHGCWREVSYLIKNNSVLFERARSFLHGQFRKSASAK